MMTDVIETFQIENSNSFNAIWNKSNIVDVLFHQINVYECQVPDVVMNLKILRTCAIDPVHMCI